jgi:phosphodiesterase/alkaline phosphatase D-like protein
VPGASPANLREPLQHRVAIRDAWSMSVSWNTYAPLNDSEAIVEYGTDPFHLDCVAQTRQSTFPTSRTWSHHAMLDGLQPKTKYYYRVAHSDCFKCNIM